MDINKIPAGKNLPSEINVFIEISQDSSVKYEFDKEQNVLFVDRFLYTAMKYPFNYGFIPQTKTEDGDPIDVLVISSLPVLPQTIIRCRPIGMLEMEDEEGIDTKIIAVPIEKVDPQYSDIKDIKDLNLSIKQKIKHFFDSYKQLEPGKWVKTKEFLSKSAAEEDIKKHLL
ncbi:MAG TPA: inorganic diphosphatase [Candidatus Pacearchaeota archaeon]|nr:inorganic diphosphatase [Candidatus Pacearchaeota archaeon]